MPFSDEQKEEIKKVIEDLGATLPCPRCSNTQFILLDGYLSPAVQADLKKTVLGGTGLPVAAVVCNRCGFLSQHALGVLGLLPKEAQPPPEEDQEGDAND